jgi:demethylmenaquinone methyltransferase/2-methoxy-6-polyprenyl-1,4-benzoquinol methylase
MSVDKSQSRIREMFGEISPRYDFLNHFLSAGIDRYWRWKTVRCVPPEGSDPILDVCTGTGDLALAYWRSGKRAVPVVGTDFTHPMLTQARAKIEKFAAHRRERGATAAISVLEADTQQLPFADDCFQIVSVAFGLRNCSDTRRALEEMVRVCRTGGRVAVLEFSLPTNRVLRALYGFYFRRVLPLIGQLLSGSRQSAYCYLPVSVSEFPQGEALAELMRQCGLREVAWQPLTFGVATLYHGRKRANSE